MRIFSILVLVVFAAFPAWADPCASHWRIDHYVHDAVLHRNWAVLVNCENPAVPARMELAPRGVNFADLGRGKSKAKMTSLENGRPEAVSAIAVKAGAPVEVSNAANSVVNMRLVGTAMQSAYKGQTIRVRLNADGHFVNAVVRGRHSVQLAESSRPVWGRK